NNLSGGSWRPRWRRDRSAQTPVAAPPVAEGTETVASAGPREGPGIVAPAGLRSSARGDEWSEPAASPSVVRPYTWTGGRTAPVVDLAVETLVSTTEHGREVAVLTSAEHRVVAELCHAPRSVAEVAALLSLPLGVARVLLADMAGNGLGVVDSRPRTNGGETGNAVVDR